MCAVKSENLALDKFVGPLVYIGVEVVELGLNMTLELGAVESVE